MCKVGEICNVGLEPQQMCHTPSLIYIYIYMSTLEVIFTITHSLSASDWFDHHLAGLSSLTRGKKQQLGFWTVLRFPALTLVNAWSNWPETLPKLRSPQSTFFCTKTKVGRWLSLGCIEFLLLLFCVDRWLDSVDFCWLWVDCCRSCPRGSCDTFWLADCEETFLVEASCWPP